MKSTRYYMKHLQRYFDLHYGEYGETAGWLVNPRPNQWQFVILELGFKVTLTCSDTGFVSEKITLLQPTGVDTYAKH